jgi:NADH:ubiquinone oxidoreductase subunit 5 (subunit L)/multisubunit Na+/H+ antiporter MnhA subunit
MGGTFLLSGYWSKDAILLAAEEASPWLMTVLLVGAGMTAAYIFRLYLRCFEAPAAKAPGHAAHGAHHGESHAPHESPMIMVLPMALLGLGAAAVGLAESPWFGHPFMRLLGDPHTHEHIDIPVTLWSTGALAAGIALAWIVGVRGRNPLPKALHPLGHALYTLAFRKYYVDELYDRWIIRPVVSLAQRLTAFDQRVIDGAVNGAGEGGDWISRLQAAFDRTVVDGAVNGVASVTRSCGMALRWVQRGVVQQSLLMVVAAVVLLSVAFGLSP